MNTTNIAKLSLKTRLLRVSHLLFALFLLTQILPQAMSKLRGKTDLPVADAPLYAIVFIAAVEVILIAVSLLARKKETLTLFCDIIAFVYILFIAWTLATAKFNVIREQLFPPPGVVLRQFVEDASPLLGHIGASLLLIARGFALALVTAIPLGLVFGSSARFGSAAGMVSKFIGSIPPVVYIPYGIALLPTFKTVSAMVIFLASFWPIFGGTMSGVMLIDRTIINSARALGVGRVSMLFHVTLNAALPQIMLGASQALTVSFILLTSAEMIAARNGLGFYVKNYSDLGNYTKTIVGVIAIGIVISLVFLVFNRIQKFLLRWR
uniref:Binding-protein-dependent transport systems inner membrane component n=1 Tax=uncultured bacterium contig00045 TaxID=1181531 RepID=A0A806KPK7_9BACT|nr:binding-protein-dependent transport systems inner membrane component [uncultured bacterium contig00045]